MFHGNRALNICIAAVLLVGCGESEPPIGAPGAMATSSIDGRSHNGYDVTRPLLYVTNFIAWTVTVYHASAKDPAPIATVSQGLNAPAGDCIDSHGTLYVTNEPISGPGWVSEYPLGMTKPSRIIGKGIDTPAYCAVVEFAPGSTKPLHRKISKDLENPEDSAYSPPLLP